MLKFDKSKDNKLIHWANILENVVTFEVLKLDKSNNFKLVQRLNISSTVVRDGVLKYDKFKEESL